MDVDHREKSIHDLEDDSNSGQDGFNEHLHNLILQVIFF